MDKKIAEIVCRLLPKYRKIECCDCDYKQWCVPEQQAILALIEQEQKPMVEALKMAKDYVEDASNLSPKEGIRAMAKEDLAEINKVLGDFNG